MMRMLVVTLLFVVARMLVGCGPVEVEIEPVEDTGHWGIRYIEDNCDRCPECCVRITENGFIDEYGVERPMTWLPTDEPLVGDLQHCSDCPGPDCICDMEGAGLWWVDETLGDD